MLVTGKINFRKSIELLEIIWYSAKEQRGKVSPKQKIERKTYIEKWIKNVSNVAHYWYYFHRSSNLYS